MIAIDEIRNRLASYIANEVSFAEFEDWLIDESWNMHKDSSDEAQQLVHDVNEKIYDYLNRFIGEDGLRAELRPYVERYTASLTFAAAAQSARPRHLYQRSSSSLPERQAAVFAR